MNVELRPIRVEEFDAYRERATQMYALDMIENGGFSEEAAWRKARADQSALLPAGLDTPGVSVLVVEADGEPVGRAVLGGREREGVLRAFLYDIEIEPAHRGRGLGRQAMELVEQRARADGHHLIELNVFGGNAVARRLYGSLGYRETFVTMTKEIG